MPRDHFNEIRDGDDNPVALSIFQAERAAAQLRAIADGTAHRRDADLVAQFLYALAWTARPTLAHPSTSPAVDPHHTWEQLAFLPIPTVRDDAFFTAETPVYVITSRPSFHSADATIVACTSINAAMWPPAITTGVHVAYHHSIDDEPLPIGTAIAIPGEIRSITLTVSDPHDHDVYTGTTHIDALHNNAMTVRKINR
ncbi:MAG: hypothetical protein WBD41_02655 [Rhodococcus sp. (in: high G+C Gram-positive bacteria)]